MFYEHWLEIAKNKELMALAPDLERYSLLEEAGSLITLYAYDRDDNIIGYSVNIISPHLHYKELITAYNDLLYVKKEYRKGSVGIRLISETERVCRNSGAEIILFHAKEQTSLAGILPRKGYKTHEIIFSKEL